MRKTTALAPVTATVSAYRETVLDFAKASKAENTQRAYRAAWAEFMAWCHEHGAAPLPASPDVVAAYLSALAAGQWQAPNVGDARIDRKRRANLKLSSLNIRRAAVSFAHRTAGHLDPCSAELVKTTMGGIARKLAKQGRTQPTRKAPATDDIVRQLVATIDRDTLPGKRDSALLLVGFAGAFRRSELVALDVEDLRFTAHDLKISIRQSKTDQLGEGALKTLPRLKDESDCPVLALREWLDAAKLKSGPVFRRFNKWGSMGQRLAGQMVGRLVKQYAGEAGLDARQFSGHSLRAGFVTSAHGHGADSLSIREQTGHKSDRMISAYIRDAGQSAKRATRAAFGEDSG